LVIVVIALRVMISTDSRANFAVEQRLFGRVALGKIG
jgi:hypothetical protein